MVLFSVINDVIFSYFFIFSLGSFLFSQKKVGYLAWAPESQNIRIPKPNKSILARQSGIFKDFIGFHIFGYDFWEVGGDVWRCLCRHMPFMSMGGQADGLAWAYPGARNPTSVSGNYLWIASLIDKECSKECLFLYTHPWCILCPTSQVSKLNQEICKVKKILFMRMC